MLLPLCQRPTPAGAANWDEWLLKTIPYNLSVAGLCWITLSASPYMCALFPSQAQLVDTNCTIVSKRAPPNGGASSRVTVPPHKPRDSL
jgi:hypothetical protein